jgi:sarcosine oxidase subunit gamma
MTLGDHRVYWLGPDEWLIVTSINGTRELVTELREALSGQHASVAELSGGQIAMRINGPRVRDVLAKGCTLDLHPAEFAVGACAQSGLAKANVLIGRFDEESGFEIVVRRSFAEYLALWLEHAAAEFNVGFSVI